MMAQMVITLREGFEAALLMAILVAYLRKNSRAAEIRYAYVGAALAVVLGALASAVVASTFGGLDEEQKALFEGVAAYLAVAVLTYMIVWMAGKNVRAEIEWKAKSKVSWGIAGVAFIFVVREVFETVLFLTPYASMDSTGTVIGFALGLSTALVLSYAIFRLEYSMDVRRFFLITGILLAFIASGLAGYGTHELIEFAEERGYESWLFEKAYSLGLDSSSPLHHKGVVGGILAVMFGYSASMEWLRIFIQLGYLTAALALIARKYGSGSRSAERATPSL